EGQLLDIDPVPGEHTLAQGRSTTRHHRDPREIARELRERAEAKNLSIRELVIDITARQTFIGSAETIAATINDLVQRDAADGFILAPHVSPGGLDTFAAQVVPLLQERGVFRDEYEGTTLREHLGLAHPDA
ncbi:F420-dependent methylene-tetrahydromethanopterin reductase, partial [Streptomyces sp. SID13588]|nr:F420-dependent methylene-tetrahydromethanopterin reductase [Streptomyces sp. SID13588]